MAIQEMLISMDGLSVGDAFGERFFGLDPLERIHNRQLPDGIWHWTDDTHMALSIVESLLAEQGIQQDALVRRFVWRYFQDRRLGYGNGARQLLEAVASGQNWRIASRSLFGNGSYGNGAAMRVAPLGGYFAGDLERAAHEARLSAEVTHAHPEGIAGGIAIGVAAALAAQETFPVGNAFIETVWRYTPEGLTRQGIAQAMTLPANTSVEDAAQILGTGSKVAAHDTVPFCLWCAAYHLDNYEEALWATVAGLGDRDTTCAIVGGIVALSARNIPANWLEHREPIPDYSIWE